MTMSEFTLSDMPQSFYRTSEFSTLHSQHTFYNVFQNDSIRFKTHAEKKIIFVLEFL